jgi:hypothetical protein
MAQHQAELLYGESYPDRHFGYQANQDPLDHYLEPGGVGKLRPLQKELEKFMAGHLRRKALIQRLVKAGIWKGQ